MHIYKKIIIVFVIIVLIPKFVQATDEIIKMQLEELNLSSFIKEGEKYAKDSLEKIDMEEVLNSAVKGKIEGKSIYNSLLKILGKEISSSIAIMGGILAIIVIHAILKNIGENIGNNSVSQITYYAQYILIVTLIMTSFLTTVDIVKTSVINLTSYINILVPLLLALIATSGTAITASVIQPIILAAIVFIGNGINLYVIPVLMISTVLGIVSNLSDKIQIKKLSKMLKSSIVWIIGFVFTLFVSILSLEGTLTSSVDGLTIKGLKTVSNTFVPVVGKALSDSVDTVLGATAVIKNAVGVVGIIVVIGICAIPIIKLIVLNVLYNLAQVIAEPLADKKIVNVIGEIAGAFKVLLGIMFCVTALLIIGIAIILKISNTGLMMRIRNKNMVNWLNSWTQKIIIVIVVCTIIEMILPEGKNKKYIKTVIGIYVVFTIISPVISKINNGTKIDLEKYFYQNNNYSETVTVSSKIDTNKYIEETYRKNLKTEITKTLLEDNYEVENIKIEIETKDGKEYGNITYLEIILTKKEEKKNIKINKIQIGENNNFSETSLVSEEEKIKVKNILSKLYKIEENKIVIK